MEKPQINFFYIMAAPTWKTQLLFARILDKLSLHIKKKERGLEVWHGREDGLTERQNPSAKAEFQVRN